MRALSAGVDHVWFGSQAFSEAKAFHPNLAVWNTASVTTMCWVCAAFSGGAPPQARRARPVFDAARPVVRGGTADVLCAQTFKYSLAQISACMQNYRKKR